MRGRLFLYVIIPIAIIFALKVFIYESVFIRQKRKPE
jgi:hypothetical protein